MNRKWAKEEEEILVEVWPYFRRGEIKKDDLCGVLNRTWGGIENKAKKIGLTSEPVSMVNNELLKKIRNKVNGLRN